MYTQLGSVTLKTGEQMELGLVRCPDAAWAAQVGPLLGHKPGEFREHIERSLIEPLDDLDTRYYLGTIGGVAVTNVMIVGARGAGILGHVYTRPEQRRKGAYSALMAVQMEDTRRAGYRILTLGTGFESPPYWIYHSFGFRSIDGRSGSMKWLAAPEAEAEHFRPGSTTARPLRWDDWAALNVLAFQPPTADEAPPRAWSFHLAGQGNLEGSFLRVRREIARRGAGRVLESEHGAIVGWAVLQPDPLSWDGDWRLDLHVHPAFRAGAGALLESVPWPADRRVAAYITAADDFRTASFRTAGFRPVATLEDWLRLGESRHSIQVLARA